MSQRLADALCRVFESPHVPDDNLEAANVVDVINRHARATLVLAAAIDHLAVALSRSRGAAAAEGVATDGDDGEDRLPW